MFDRQLFIGDKVRLAAPDADKDVEIESKWTLDLDYLRAINVRPAYPLNLRLMKKHYEEQQKEAEKRNLFWWTVRLRSDDRLIGWIKFEHLNWPHGTATLEMAIGAPADRNQGYGGDVMKLALRYAFNEINLHRVGVYVPGYNAGALRFFARFGFVEEVRRREALLLHGQRYDDVWLGLLRHEWRSLLQGKDRTEDVSSLLLGEGWDEGNV